MLQHVSYYRSVHPTYGFLIMNRLNTENMEDVITPAMEFQTQEPFVLYKSAKTSESRGRGAWGDGLY